MEDRELLHEYAVNGSEKAFSELVLRYTDMVYSACLRQLQDPDLAGDATQAVFLALSRKALKIRKEKVLSGWLFKASNFASLNIIRAKKRRKKHEKEAVIMKSTVMDTDRETGWNGIASELDNALMRLNRNDRNAVILRYFQGKSYAELGRELDISENTATKRVERALKKLRRYFSKKGMMLSNSLFAGLIGENAVRPAPADISEASIKAACGHASVEAGSMGNVNLIAKGVIKMMIYEKIKAAALIGGILLTAGIAAFAGTADISGPGSEPASTVRQECTVCVLDTQSPWAVRQITGTELVRTESGELVHLHPENPTRIASKIVNGKKRRIKELAPLPAGNAWFPAPPDQWTGPEYNDSSWSRLKGPFGGCTFDRRLKKRGKRYISSPAIYLRGVFFANDPAGAGGLCFSMDYHGGAAVYVNGTEVTRQHLAKGKLTPLTPAQDYKRGIYEKNGFLGKTDTMSKEKAAEAFNSTVRRIQNLVIPAHLLRKGKNVLAVEIHRAPAEGDMFVKMRYSWKSRSRPWWSRIGVYSLELKAPEGAGVRGASGNTGRPEGIQVWTQPVFQYVRHDMYITPGIPPMPIRLFGAKNGTFSGQAVVGSKKETEGVKAACTGLTGPGGSLKAQVRYPLYDGKGNKWTPRHFHTIVPDLPPPAKVTTYRYAPPNSAGALQPVWVTVTVPEDAKPGTYSGTLTVSASGLAPVKVPVSIEVADWTIPDSTDFFCHVGAFQSPESVAAQYKVPMWSEKHWKLIERSFELMGGIGVDTVYITAVRRTHLGNDHSMVRYSRKNGKLIPDFSIADRYLGLAVKHLGKVPVVGLYIFEINAPQATCYPSSASTMDRSAETSRRLLVSVKSKGNGPLEKAEGPEWGTEECREFLTHVISGMKKLVAKHELPESSLLIGTSGDYEPNAVTVGDFMAVAPDVKWISHSHVVRHRIGPKNELTAGYICAAWGGHAVNVDPDVSRHYGWKNDFLRCVTREGPRWLRLEAAMTAKMKAKRRYKRQGVGLDRPDFALRGIGRQGADFWANLTSGERKARTQKTRGHTYFGRFQEAHWGQLNVCLWTPAMFSPGPEGASWTVNTELIRENQQEIEARIFIEKALHNKAEREKLGEELAVRAQKMLDARTRLVSYKNYREALCLDVQGLSHRLYSIAAEIGR